MPCGSSGDARARPGRRRSDYVPAQHEGGHGRFHRPGTEKFGVILMPGDIAPYWLNLGPHGEFLGREAITWELLAEL